MRDWTAALNTSIRQGSYRPRKLLVFLNPYGGAKRARQVWQTVVEPIFDLASAPGVPATSEIILPHWPPSSLQMSGQDGDVKLRLLRSTFEIKVASRTVRLKKRLSVWLNPSHLAQACKPGLAHRPDPSKLLHVQAFGATWWRRSG